MILVLLVGLDSMAPLGAAQTSDLGVTVPTVSRANPIMPGEHVDITVPIVANCTSFDLEPGTRTDVTFDVPPSRNWSFAWEPATTSFFVDPGGCQSGMPELFNVTLQAEPTLKAPAFRAWDVPIRAIVSKRTADGIQRGQSITSTVRVTADQLVQVVLSPMWRDHFVEESSTTRFPLIFVLNQGNGDVDVSFRLKTYQPSSILALVALPPDATLGPMYGPSGRDPVLQAQILFHAPRQTQPREAYDYTVFVGYRGAHEASPRTEVLPIVYHLQSDDDQAATPSASSLLSLVGIGLAVALAGRWRRAQGRR